MKELEGQHKWEKYPRKTQERLTLKWYGHVIRRDEEYVGNIVMRIDVDERRKKGRPSWMDSIYVD